MQLSVWQGFIPFPGGQTLGERMLLENLDWLIDLYVLFICSLILKVDILLLSKAYNTMPDVNLLIHSITICSMNNKNNSNKLADLIGPWRLCVILYWFYWCGKAQSTADSKTPWTMNYVEKLAKWDLWVDKQTFLYAFCFNTCFSYSLTYTKSGVTWKCKTHKLVMINTTRKKVKQELF